MQKINIINMPYADAVYAPEGISAMLRAIYMQKTI